MLLGKGHVSEDILFGTIHQRSEFRNLRPDLVGDTAPLGARRRWRVLSKCRGNEGGHDATSALSGLDQGIAHEVNHASLPGPD